MSTHKIKEPKNLQKSLHLEYYISTYHNKFHVQIVNILFIKLSKSYTKEKIVKMN
jgi:hypothetical protein